MLALMTVVELPEFLKRASALMSEKEQEELVGYIACHPHEGISLGGGLRKIRIAQKGKGKSGSLRVVYIFSRTDIPLFLLTIFAKNEKANLTSKEQEVLKKASKALIELYRSQKQ